VKCSFTWKIKFGSLLWLIVRLYCNPFRVRVEKVFTSLLLLIDRLYCNPFRVRVEKVLIFK